MSLQKIIQWEVESKYSKWVMLLVLAFILVFCLGVKKLTFSADYKTFFDEDNPELIQLEELQNTYSKTDNVFVMIAPANGDVFTTETISLIHQLTQEFWQIPYSSRVDSITNYSNSSAMEDDILIEEFVYDQSDITPELVEYMKDEVLKEKDLLGKIVTNSGQNTAINISINLPGLDIKSETEEVNEVVWQVISKYQQLNPEHAFYVSGLVIMNGAFMDIAQKDLATLIPALMLFVLVVAGYIIGSVRAALIIMAVVVLCFTGALGLAGWTGIKLSSPSVSAPIIMFTIIVASSIHLITYVKTRRVEGASAPVATLDSFEKNLKPVLLSHVTTIVGFLAMNNGSSPPFRDLGNIVVMGVSLSLLLTLTFLPFLLSRVDISQRPSLLGRTRSFSQALAEVVIDYRRTIIILSVPLSLFVLVAGFQNELNDNLVDYFDETVEFRQHADEVDKHYSGISNIDYSIETGEEDAIFEKDVLKFVEKFESWLTQQPEVVAVDSVLHRIKDLNRLMNNNDDAYYKVLDQKSHNAQSFLLYEMSLPFGRDASNMVAIDKSSLKVTARLRNQSSQQILDFEEKVSLWLDENKIQRVDVKYSSPSLIFSNIGQDNISNMLNGAFFALLIISFGLVFIFRSFWVGLSSLLPNILPIAAAYGVWYLLDGQISMGLASVAAMTIGIVVDDTVHFFFQYLNGLKNGLSREEAVRETFRNTMSAIIISSLLLVAGFMLLILSSFQKNADIGLLTSITILIALFFDIFMLPALAVTFTKRKEKIASVFSATSH
ncbi:efflux RND transporter permease subunit [Grimontia marina]|uniref:Bifunctional preprotein translocase subunit SecD/SecF n=1 Tax=Grimontia marina TaxID=646534 RepID=A0A128FBQ8_9GAMM|nr:efflux RND transporter permease subunit [Grimontia marina]CZF83764.1 bifunctional preprotein translocase subunit SecD/SecF [Grimontia marina]